jgi:hypothetical protein
MAVAESDAASPEAASNMIEDGIRALVRRNRLAVAAEMVKPEHSEDPLKAGEAAIADIDKLMGELQLARDYLQSEGDRVRQMMARYAHLAETASASVKIIADNVGRWCNSDKQADLALPHTSTPDLSPADDIDGTNGLKEPALTTDNSVIRPALGRFSTNALPCPAHIKSSLTALIHHHRWTVGDRTSATGWPSSSVGCATPGAGASTYCCGHRCTRTRST